jgi:hypothetical protein
LSTELGPVENPLDVLRQPHQNAEPEMRFFWASKRQIDNGRHLDKEAVTAANGDPVRYRNMVLMKYPQQAAEAKMARNKARSERLLNSIASDHIREVQKRLGPTMSAPEMNAFVTAMERETQTQGAQLNG